MRQLTQLIALALITSLLCSCTKTAPGVNDENMLCVTQLKGNVSISLTVNPKPYLRISDIVVEFGEKKVSARFFIFSGETHATKTFQETAHMTGYYTVTLMKYGE